MKRVAGLSVIERDAPGSDGPTIVLLHGFGAPGDDLVPLAEVVDAPAGARFVFPAAPLQPPGLAGGRAWWMIDLERFERPAPSIDRAAEIPVGLDEARAQVLALIQALAVPAGKLVLGGFSQGAMLALDVALHLPEPPARLALLSGTLIAEAVWAPRLPRLAGVPVFQSHGSDDPLLPFAAAERLAEMLRRAGAQLTWAPFDGEHEIPPAVLRALSSFLR